MNKVQNKKRSPWIDPDTPETLRKVVSFPELPFDNDVEREFELVFSDEFNVNGRTMHDGDAVKTENGILNITMDVHPETFTYTDHVFQQVKKEPTGEKINVTKEFRSGMVQSWNKFCFIGGIIEISAKLPGDPKTGGLWPASKSLFTMKKSNLLLFGF